MWFLTAVKKSECGWHDFDKRTYGWFETREQLRDALVTDATSLPLTGDVWLVAEAVKPGMLGQVKTELWYKLVGYVWKQIEKPKEFEHLTNWFIG